MVKEEKDKDSDKEDDDSKFFPAKKMTFSKSPRNFLSNEYLYDFYIFPAKNVKIH